VRRRGIASGHLHWLLGIALDYEGDLEAAIHHFQEALRRDPLALPFHHLRDVVQNRLVAMLYNPDRAVDAEDTPALYEALKSLGPVSGETHLVMARYLQAKGELARALELTRAVLLLDESPQAGELADQLASSVSGDLAPRLGQGDTARA
jgi:tetratricopeptide (TPR) repeat protein